MPEILVKLGLSPTGRGCSIHVDDKDLSHNTKAVLIEAAVGQPTRVTITLHNVRVESEGTVNTEGVEVRGTEEPHG